MIFRYNHRMNYKTTAWISAVILALVSFSFANPALAAEKNEKSALEAATQFYAALNQMFTGDITQMKEVWSHADDVTYMGPTGGFDKGWGQVLKSWEAQAAMKLGGKVEGVDMLVTAGGDIAVVSDYENGENTNAKGEVQKVSIRATNIFRKEGGKWKMIGHHTDLLPYLAK